MLTFSLEWDQYDVTNGFGWNSMYINVPNTVQLGIPVLQCGNIGNGNTLQQTVCYDNYNTPDEFHFQVAPGVYNVTVAIGWEGSCRPDTEFVSVNNVVLRNFTCNSTNCCNSREYWGLVTVFPASNGGEVIMTFGNHQGYTILGYMMIVGVTPSTTGG